MCSITDKLLKQSRMKAPCTGQIPTGVQLFATGSSEQLFEHTACHTQLSSLHTGAVWVAVSAAHAGRPGPCQPVSRQSQHSISHVDRRQAAAKTRRQASITTPLRSLSPHFQSKWEVGSGNEMCTVKGSCQVTAWALSESILRDVQIKTVLFSVDVN